MSARVINGVIVASAKDTAANTNPVSEGQRLFELFRSNQRSIGHFDPKTGRMHTKYRAPVAQDFVVHLSGKEGIGCVPILDNGACQWAAIDIDNHGSEDDIPIAPIDDKIRKLKLPLIPCRSKSGGVHAYLFFAKPQPASKVRDLMNGYAAQLGYAGAEVFPKQAKLLKGKDDKQQLGNWINLPYLGADETMRYGFYQGRKLSVAGFLSLADKLRVSDDDMRAQAETEHPQAPPCVQRMLAEGVGAGHRNEALFNIVVYLKKAHPDSYEPRAQTVNSSVFTKPLPRSECARTIVSAARPDYSYRCNEEPIRSLCDKDTCIKRKFGITKGEFDLLSAKQALPPLTDLIKFITEPVRWELKMDGVLVTNVPTEVLLNFRSMRVLIADRLTRVTPLIKDEEWQRVLEPLMAGARVVEAPDEASVAGMIRTKLREFSGRCDLMSKGEDVNERKALTRGLPCVVAMDGARMIAFRAEDFTNYLKRTKSEELKGVNLWFAIKQLGVEYRRVRIDAGKHSALAVWCVPIKTVLTERSNVEAPEFKTEL